MTAGNFDAVFNLLNDRRPFRVFTVELHGGRKLEVDHPEAITVLQGIAVFVAPGFVPVWFDHDSVSQIVDAPSHVEL
jgi:hypothetical protein